MKKIYIAAIFVSLFFNSFAQNYLKDTRDGNTYKTIQVGDRIWMAENLKFESTEGASFFDNNPANKNTYGLLYTWNTATKVCPAGWRLPTGEEFKRLIDFYENGIGIEKMVKNTATINLQLGGMRDFEGTWSEIEESGYYWTSTEYDKNYAQYFGYMIILDHPVIDLSRVEDNEDVHGSEKSSGYSVRCVQ